MIRTKLNDVFTPGGQPSITYVTRESLCIEEDFKRAIALPSSIVSLTGPTKSGKTVLCRNVLEDRDYIWVEGGQIYKEEDIWNKVIFDLNQPLEIKDTEGDHRGVQSGFEAGLDADVGLMAKIKSKFSFSGSNLSIREKERTYRVEKIPHAIQHILNNDILLVIDDFHYLPPDCRLSVLRTLKGAIFDGVKVVLLSVTHRAFEAIQAEPELTGRLRHVEVPEWDSDDLRLIPIKGFDALNIKCDTGLVERLVSESHASPLLMQKFCWEICFDNGVHNVQNECCKLPLSIDLDDIFTRVAKDSGEPIYRKMATGPVTRTPRMGRPLREGGTADIYQAILFAIASTGPKRAISYDELRSKLSLLLADNLPQRLEVSNALKHLSKIASEISAGEAPLDWDEGTRTLYVVDPYFRFYLRWQVRKRTR